MRVTASWDCAVKLTVTGTGAREGWGFGKLERDGAVMDCDVALG